jgi:hypothetical protein
MQFKKKVFNYDLLNLLYKMVWYYVYFENHASDNKYITFCAHNTTWPRLPAKLPQHPCSTSGLKLHDGWVLTAEWQAVPAWQHSAVVTLLFIGQPWLQKVGKTCSCKSCVHFSKHWPSGPMLSISRNVRPSVRVFVRLFVCLSVCSLLRHRLNVFLPPLPEVGCPIFLEIRNAWGKVMERSGLRYEHFCLKIV